MNLREHHQVFIVDDDAGVRDALSWLLRTRRLLSERFDSAEAFLTHPVWQNAPASPSCLLLDVRMPGISGIALFDRLQGLPWAGLLPVIFMSGHADVATAVDAVKRGAFDFCEKPFSDNALVDRVEAALATSAQRLALSRLASELNGREQAVMQLVVEGLPNKLVADRLGLSVRTVEVYRARVFDKMGVKSAVELANKIRDL
jgi:two-component system response regulator DctR